MRPREATRGNVKRATRVRPRSVASMRPREATRGNGWQRLGVRQLHESASMRPREATRGNARQGKGAYNGPRSFNEAAGSYPRKLPLTLGVSPVASSLQ